MMNETNIKKMEELLANEEFAQKIADAGSYEKAYQLFAENGVEASYDDFMAYIEESRKLMVDKGLISEEGELSVEMLDQVSGGGKGSALVCWILAGVAFYFGQPQAGVVLVCVGIAAWNSKLKQLVNSLRRGSSRQGTATACWSGILSKNFTAFNRTELRFCPICFAMRHSKVDNGEVSASTSNVHEGRLAGKV